MLVLAELGASLLGFVVTVRWARRLGPSAFAHVEFAAAVCAWLLVIVRGGVDIIVYREAARHPRLIRPLTEVLLGLKCACAVVGYGIILAIAGTVGAERGGVVAVAGLVLLPSALVADVGPRVTGRLGWIALAQWLRALGHAAAGLCMVTSPAHVWRAAACGVVAELAGWVVPFVLHTLQYGIPRPRFRWRAWRVLAARGTVASLSRFGRVSLYGADLLALGWWAGPELGPYAAARRLVFALVALGLVVTTAVGPEIARAWLAGASRARTVIGEASEGLWWIVLPASVGLAVTARPWMAFLFGPGYRAGALWLILVAARLPWLLSATLSQSALVACRRERESLSLVLIMLALAILIVPASAAWSGPLGVSSSVLLIEAVGAIGGWHLLRRLGVAPRWKPERIGTVLGCLVMVGVCRAMEPWPVLGACLAGAAAYAATWEFTRRALRAPWTRGIVRP